MKSFDYVLEEPVEYFVNGEQTEGSRITFYAPKPNQRKKTTKLKQAFFRALPKESSETSSKPDEDIDIKGAEILFTIAQSDADYTEFIETGRSLICDKVGKIDDVEYLTTPIADRLSIDVLEDMIGEYVANFIVKSALKSLMKS